MENEKQIVDELLVIYKYLEENTVLSLKKGEKIEIKCLHCGGRVVASRAQSNGHLWVVCDNCGVLLCQ